jgi:ABC-type Mn2+/Zn2+ transport system permease subunit
LYYLIQKWRHKDSNRAGETIFYLTVTIAGTISICIMSDVFTFTVLVNSTIAALHIARCVHRIYFTAVILGLFPALLIGLYLAFKYDLPTGSSTVATYFTLLPFALLVHCIHVK